MPERDTSSSSACISGQAFEAYRILDEKSKTAIVRRVADDSPTLMRRWIREARLETGFSDKSIRSRSSDHIRHALDSALASDPDLLVKTLELWFTVGDDSINNRFMALVTGMTQPMSGDEAVEELRSEFVGDVMLPLYEAAVRETEPEWFQKDSCGGKDDAATLESMRQELVDLAGKVAAEVEEKLRLDTANTLIQNTARLLRLSEDLRRSLERACETQGVGFTKISKAEDVRSLIKRLEEKERERQEAASQSASRRMVELTAFLSGCSIEHRSSERKAALSALLAQAAREAEALSETDLALSPGGPEQPEAWLIWAFSQQGDELLKLCNSLRQRLPSLAELLNVAERAHLIFPYTKGTPYAAQQTPARAEAAASHAVPGQAMKMPGQGKGSAKAAPPPKPARKYVADEATVTETRQPSAPVAVEAHPEPPTAQDVTSIASLEEAPAIEIGTDIPAKVAPEASPPCPASDAPAKLDEENLSEITIQQLASRALEGDLEHAAELCWRLIAEGKLSEALAIAISFRHPLETASSMPFPWIVELTILNRLLASIDEPSAVAVSDLFHNYGEYLFMSFKDEMECPLSAMLASLALKGTLIAPFSGAFTLLESAELGSAQHLFRICQAASSLNQLKIPLTARLLEASISSEGMEREIKSLSGKAADMLKSFPHRSIITRPAAHVWLSWLSSQSKGVIWMLLEPIASARESAIDQVSSVLGQLRSETEIARLAERTYGQLHKGSLVSRARDQIVRYTGEAVSLARDWLELIQGKMKLSSTAQERLSLLVSTVRQHSKGAKEEMLLMGGPSAPAYAKACAVIACDSIEQIEEMIGGKWPQPAHAANPETLLYTPLTAYSGIDLGEDGCLANPEEAGKSVLRFLSDPGASITDEFKKTCEQGKLGKALAMLSALRSTGFPAALAGKADELASIASEVQAAWAKRLSDTAKKLLALVEKAVREGLLTEQEYAEHTSLADRYASPQPGGVIAQVNLSKPLEEMMAGIEKLGLLLEKSSRIAVERLADLKHAKDSRERIFHLINTGDIVSANDYMDRIEKGIALPEETPRRSSELLQFFNSNPALEEKGVIGRIEDQLSKIAPDIAIAAIRDRRSLFGLDLKRIAGTQAKKNAEFLELWTRVRKNRAADQSALKKILDWLGFTTHSITREQKADEVSFLVTCDPLADKEICPVPDFGSDIGGRYRILCIWGVPTEDEVYFQVGGRTQEQGTIVLYFGRLTEKRRRTLAERNIQQKRKFLVLDDTLAFYLATLRSAPLPAFFRCALPFSYSEPYRITSGTVSPEMFYGRKQELESIKSRMGSCFVYGGRQLGKTVLLKRATAETHDPSSGAIAIYLDLKTRLIGIEKPIDDLWPILARELREHSVVPAGVHDKIGLERLIEHIKAWLGPASSNRRLLLLLDEADKLIDEDSEDAKGAHFHRIELLKGLMDGTDRRFKVVFSGLHNVQRSTRNANNPIAHLGEPICIGPMIMGAGEAYEARRLVEEPLAAMGYFLESEDLIARILARTNYYPSLIQIYCLHLLRHAQESAGRWDVREVPPYLITSEQIDATYEQKSLMRDIRDRIMWTLDLDKRYRVLADIMSLWSEDHPDGFNVRWLHRMAIDLYSKGFSSDPSEDSFRVILEEMEGLGIVRRLEGDRVAFRSLNTAKLLGSPDEVQADLDEVISSAETPVEPRAVRRLLADKGQDRRSCLTAFQESLLRPVESSVIVACGCAAACLGDLEKSLGMIFTRQHQIVMERGDTLNSMKKHIESFSKQRSSDYFLLLVPPEVEWNDDWVRTATDYASTRTSRQRIITIVLAADPERLWENRYLLLDPGEVTFVTLGPWSDMFAGRWLSEREYLPSSKEAKDAVKTTTGCWPAFLYELDELVARETLVWREALERTSPSKKPPEETLAMFGLHAGYKRDILKVMAEYDGPLSPEEAAELAKGQKPEAVEYVMRWAEALHMTAHVTGGMAVDSCVGKLLRRV